MPRCRPSGWLAKHNTNRFGCARKPKKCCIMDIS
nr:MAG TPA: Ribosomal protein S27a [Caudoviricetes sp.]